MSVVHAQSAHAQSAQEASPQPYPAPVRAMPLQPRVDVGGRVGTERSIGVTEAWLPISQTPEADKVLYTDIRWMGDDESNQEGNLGIGYRAIVDDISGAGGKAIIGAHGWIDRRRTDRGSNFHQVTVGVEYLKEDWDVKVNAYAPLNSEKEYLTPNLGSTTPYLAGTGLFVDTNGLLVEEAQPGADIEVGYRIPTLEQDIDAIRVYGGAYGFKGDRSDDVIGGRVRASVDINPLINVGARFQYDEPRGSQGFLEATLRFPFTAKKRFQSQGLKARMDESPERDIDIVTGGTVVDNGLRKEVINTASGTTQRVLHVDNTATPGGNGSVENPFNTLAAAQAALAANDVLYIHQGNGTTTGQDQGIVIDKDNVQLIGSGTDFIFDTDRFTTRRPGPNGTDGSVILAATAAPVITNTQTDGDSSTLLDGNGVLILADNASVSGLSVTNTQGTGILAYAVNVDWDNITVMNNTVTNSGVIETKAGIQVNARDATIGNVVFDNNVSRNNRSNNINVTANANATISTATITNNTTSDSIAGNGIGVQATAADAVIINAIIEQNSATDNFNRGYYIFSNTGGTLQNISVRDNTADSNGSDTTNGYGFQIQANNAISTLGNVVFTGNTAMNSAASGVFVLSNSGPIASVLVANNTMSNNAARGLYVQGTVSGNLGPTVIDGNTISNNQLDGIFVSSQNNSIMPDLTIRDNTITANARNGVQLATANAASLTASVSGNTITGNGTTSVNPNFYYGVNVNHDSTGMYNIDLGGGALNSAGGNRIFNNFYRDIFVDSRPGTAAATPGTTIAAQHNWWGVNTGLNQATRATFDNGSASPGSSIDASNYLTVDPGL